MKVLVTGGTGFIGAHLCAACVGRGHQVRVLRRAGSRLIALAHLPIEFIVGDVLDWEAVAQAVEGCDLVFHVAAIAGYWRARRAQIYQVNVEGTRIVMEACLRAGVPRVVHTSSVAAVGISSDGPADETTPFDALSARFAYADSKRQAEEIVLEMVARGLPAVIVNPAVVIGAGDHYLNSSSMVAAYGKGGIPVVPPGGICVADVAAVIQGHLRAAERGRIGERYILGGENLSLMQVASTIAKVAGVRGPRFVVPAPLLRLIAPLIDLINHVSPFPPRISGEQISLSRINFFFNSSKAVRELDYPLLPFCGAVRQALAWYRAHKYM